MNKMTKTDIRDKAIPLFLERGYNNVTINDICEICQITKPTFYKYAGSKEELILDLYDLTINELISDTYLFIKADSHYEQLMIVFSTLMKDTKRFGSDLFSQMLISNLNEDRHSFDMRDSLTRVCTVIIQKAQEKGEIRNPNPPELLYQTVAHLFTGHEVLWCIHNSETSFEAFFECVNAALDAKEELRELYKRYI